MQVIRKNINENELELSNFNLMDDGFSNAIGTRFCKKHPNNFLCKSKSEVQRNKAKVKKAIKKTAKDVFLTYNPVVAIPRSSALLAFRVNLFGISTRLYPAFLSDTDLKKHNFDLDNAKKAKAAWEKIANFWEDKLGGSRKKLQEAISGAWNKPVLKTKKSQANKKQTSTFDASEYSNVVGAAAVSAYITAGLGVIAAISKIIGGTGASKNPYAQGTGGESQLNTQLQGAEEPTTVNQAEINRISAAAAADKKKGLGLDESGVDATQLDENGNPTSGKILGMPKPLFWSGVAILSLSAAALTIWLIKRKK